MSGPGFIDYPRLYNYRFRGVDQAVRQSVWNEIAADIHRRMGSPRRILDPAAGRCEFVNALSGTERWVVDAVDQADFRDPAVKAIIADIVDVDLPTDYFDGIFVSNFLEHLATQEAVAQVLVKLRSSALPGGRIAVLGPNFKYCAREYFDCADHTLALSHVAVAEHLHAAGFEVSVIIPRYLPFSFRGVLPPSPTLTRTYLRLPLAWKLLGKQFLVLATKPPGCLA
ncbi:MAG: class I SAM-dependent methyltransferase [Actinomycetota bacterium]|nr:class I SAM-dependent methyltransferase [Actinomycetota bacterium]